MDYKDNFCDAMYSDPEYIDRMEELQRYDYEVMGELWEEDFRMLPEPEDFRND